jgi:antitoxin (DNA-binding transcriptional repressor) of toxin-antitoxin stability system
VIEKTMTLSSAREQFGEAVRRAHDLRETTLVIENGRALARIVPVQPPDYTAQELAVEWNSLPHLDPSDAEDFAADVSRAILELLPPKSKWE